MELDLGPHKGLTAREVQRTLDSDIVIIIYSMAEISGILSSLRDQTETLMGASPTSYGSATRVGELTNCHFVSYTVQPTCTIFLAQLQTRESWMRTVC